jgi:threonyl-tRNA synthetase
VLVILVGGKRKMEEKTVTVRRLGSQDQKVATLAETLAALVREALSPDLR